MKVNKLRSSQNALNWLNSIDSKEEKTLVKVDIRDYYPLITRKVIVRATIYIQDKSIQISEEEEDQISKQNAK